MENQFEKKKREKSNLGLDRSLCGLSQIDTNIMLNPIQFLHTVIMEGI